MSRIRVCGIHELYISTYGEYIIYAYTKTQNLIYAHLQQFFFNIYVGPRLHSFPVCKRALGLSGYTFFVDNVSYQSSIITIKHFIPFLHAKYKYRKPIISLHIHIFLENKLPAIYSCGLDHFYSPCCTLNLQWHMAVRAQYR